MYWLENFPEGKVRSQHKGEKDILIQFSLPGLTLPIWRVSTNGGLRGSGVERICDPKSRCWGKLQEETPKYLSFTLSAPVFLLQASHQPFQATLYRAYHLPSRYLLPQGRVTFSHRPRAHEALRSLLWQETPPV